MAIAGGWVCVFILLLGSIILLAIGSTGGWVLLYFAAFLGGYIAVVDKP